MPAHDYVFITRWRVSGTCEEVYEVLRRAEALPRWWPSVYLRVTTLTEPQPGAHGLGGEVELHTKGWLPYTLRWRSRIVSTQHPGGFALEADGDFVGAGVWRLRQVGDEVDIEFDWRIRADKPFLRTWSWLLNRSSPPTTAGP